MTGITTYSVLCALKSIAVLLLSLDIHFDGFVSASQDVNSHLEEGKKLLATGNFVDALSHYDAAVAGDPKNYLTYFRRATVYLALGKSKSALPDLDKSIELRPGFSAALTQRGNVLLKMGRIRESAHDYEELYLRDKQNTEALEYLNTIQPLENDIKMAKDMYERQDYEGAIMILSKVIDLCPWDPEIREIRAECYIAQGDFFKATGDIRPTTKLRNDNTKGYFKLSNLHYLMGEADEALSQVKECLKLDQDHKECFPFYKKVKKLVKQIQSGQEHSNEGRWEECINKANQMLQTEPSVQPYVLRARSLICHCQAKGGDGTEALKSCNQVLEMDPDNIDALCDHAEAYIANEQYEEAIQDFQRAINVDQENRKAKEGISRAQKLLKNSKKRDYYRILGVSRNAKKKAILKAYRKLAGKWHPDKYEGDDSKHAEKMFLDIAAAKEVLTNPEMRAKYDQGEDPLDPEQQNQGGGHPFNPFGSGGGGGNQGFNFKFHFN